MHHSPLARSKPLATGERGRSPRRGAALITAISLVLTLSMVALSFLTVSVDSSRQASSRELEFRIASAAESATMVAVHELWSGFLNQSGGVPGSMLMFRAYMDGLGIPNHNTGGINGAPIQGLAKSSLLGVVTLPTDAANGDELAGVRIEGLDVTRSDEGKTTNLYFQTTVGRQTDGGVPQQETVQQGFVVQGDEWYGLEYSLLANNVNCIFCHARIDNVERFYNFDPALYGTFPRVRVGSMEELRLKPSDDTTIAGTLYTRGRAMTSKGLPITDWATMGMKGFQFDSNGNIVEDPWGNTTLTDLVPADPVNPAPLENLYIDYDRDEAKMVDGYLPIGFPPPFPDDGGFDPATGLPTPGAANNRVVDPSEYYAVAATATGSVKGGTIYVAVPGDTVTSNGDLGKIAGGNQLSLGADTRGNVVLVGTQTNPILLDGIVAIDGDVILQGYVKGEGALLVRGNVYIPSDVKYLDGQVMGMRTYGKAADNTTNTLAIASGGNIIVGNQFYTKKATTKSGSSVPPVTGDPSGTFNFVMTEIAVFNRGEWTKAQPMLPGEFDDPNNPATWSVVNPDYKPEFVPRYYAFGENLPVPIFQDGYYDPVLGWVGKEKPGGFGSMNAYPWDPTDPLLYDASGNPIAAVRTLGGTGGWITEDMLRQLVDTADAARTPGDPFILDGLLYSNNSVFGIVGNASSAGGQMIANGGFVAADIGLIVPTQLNLNYDIRPKEMLDLRSDENMTIQRMLWVPTVPLY